MTSRAAAARNPTARKINFPLIYHKLESAECRKQIFWTAKVRIIRIIYKMAFSRAEVDINIIFAAVKNLNDKIMPGKYTFTMIKPDAVSAKNAGPIIKMIEDAGGTVTIVS